ncbi:sulfotransferase family protein [Marixanthomonas ophiurae]|uniref:Sulfotransferase family protein n=1 Tax=Marixanthomonas ophiurae TaxID=387659 RepID=A0A3E1Q781_9FLAO|nr:hypothetical protein [Marixanthomonas ophiurae]RFN57970.1 hypothetical protein DZ858_12060 [Marixanthomonas ophiurae]
MFYDEWWIYQKVYLKHVRKKQVKKYLEQVRNKEKPLFIHINKTAGSSIAKSMGITEIHYTLAEYEQLYFNQFNETLPKDIAVWTSIRNPFDKVASEYFYRVKHNQNKMDTNPISFEQWVIKAYEQRDPFYRDREIMFNTQCSWIESEINYNISFIRFENLQEDYNKLALKYNGVPLVWKKKSKNKNYKDYFSERTKKIISNEFKEDLKHFNYTY